MLGGGGSTNIWKIPYVLSFLFLKASLLGKTSKKRVKLVKLDNLASKVKQCYLMKSARSSMQHRCLETSNSQK